MGQGTRLLCAGIVVLMLTGCGGSETVTTTVTANDTEAALSTTDQPPSFTLAAARDFVREHYHLVNRGDYHSAFTDFSSDARVDLGSKSDFVAGYRDTISTDVHDLSATKLSANAVSVSFSLSAQAEDACGDTVDQEYTGSWIVKQRSSGLVLDKSDIQQLDGQESVSSEEDCPISIDSGPGPGSDSPPPVPSCVPGYDPCLDPDSYDYDCAGGSGDGPDYIDGPVYVTGSDPFGLDADGNGVGCE